MRDDLGEGRGGADFIRDLYFFNWFARFIF